MGCTKADHLQVITCVHSESLECTDASALRGSVSLWHTEIKPQCYVEGSSFSPYLTSWSHLYIMGGLDEWHKETWLYWNKARCWGCWLIKCLEESTVQRILRCMYNAAIKLALISNKWISKWSKISWKFVSVPVCHIFLVYIAQYLSLSSHKALNGTDLQPVMMSHACPWFFVFTCGFGVTFIQAHLLLLRAHMGK